MVSVLGYSEFILSDIGLYKLHGSWTRTFLCHKTKNVVKRSFFGSDISEKFRQALQNNRTKLSNLTTN